MDSSVGLFVGLLFSAIGLGFFIYGKKQQQYCPLLVGIALMVYPYFFADLALLSLIGGVLLIVPYFFRV